MIAEVEANIKGPNGEPGIAVRTPFSQAFVDALKKWIPREQREWREKTGSWWVHEQFTSEVESLVLEFWPEYLRVGGEHNGEIVGRRGVVAVQESLF